MVVSDTFLSYLPCVKNVIDVYLDDWILFHHHSEARD